MDSILPPDGIAMHAPILFWWLALEGLGLLTFPWAFITFAGLADRGWIVSKTLGPVILAYLVWIGPATGLVQFDRTEILAALILFALAGIAGAFLVRRDLGKFLQSGWRAMLSAEVVFLAGFGLFLWLRSWYPDLGHQFSPVSPTNPGDGRMGEKQMEMAFLNAIVRSRVFPPLDPFFAHGYINYYYFGFVLVATLCKLTQIATATGFNLAIAGFFGMLVGNVFAVTQSLTRRVWPGVVGAAFVGIIGNLAGAWQVVTDLMGVGGTHSSIPLVGGFVDTASGFRAVLVDHAQLNAFDFWEPTRIIPPVGLGISEFPYFTYLFADLHPHLMAFPMTAVALAFAVSLALSGYRSHLHGILAWTLVSVLFGAILATNPWDFPTYLVVVGIGAVVGAWATRGLLAPAVLLRPSLWCIGLAAGGFLLFFPFEHSYKTVFSSGLGFTRDLVGPVCAGSASSCTGGAYDTLVTPLSVYLEHFGLFLFLLLSLLFLLLTETGAGRGAGRLITRLQFAYYYRDRIRQTRRAARAARAMRRRRPLALDATLTAAVIVISGGLILVHLNLLGFLAAVSGLVLVLLHRLGPRLPTPHLFVLVLSLVPLGLSFLTQVVYVKDFLDGGNLFRMNTLFKFYNQAWVLFSVVGAFALWFAVKRLSPELSPIAPGANGDALNPDVEASRIAVIGRFVDRNFLWSGFLAILLVSSLVYTYAGTVSRETYRASWLPENSVPLTLDGMAFVKVAYPGDYGGISWINANVRGAPVIAEADSGYYQWPSRVSMFTGLPDIINGNHEPEQRYADELGSRETDLNTLYDSPHPAAAWRIIHKYGVRYIFVGWLEEHCTHRGGDPNAPTVVCYSLAGIKKFQKMVGHGLETAYRRGDTVIYRVTGA